MTTLLTVLGHVALVAAHRRQAIAVIQHICAGAPLILLALVVSVQTAAHLTGTTVRCLVFLTAAAVDFAFDGGDDLADAAHPDAAFQLGVAAVAPADAPTVANQPVGDAVRRRAKADHSDGVVRVAAAQGTAVKNAATT